MTPPIYLDSNATAKARPEAIEAVEAALRLGGNPSSVHAAGRAARGLIEAARADVARLVGATPGAVTFVSGGTEANALAMASAVAAGHPRIIISATEHEAVRATAESFGLGVEIWPVDANGLADLADLERRLREADGALVCLMLANNETGVIQHVAEAARLVHHAGGWLHVDAVQGAGKIAIDMASLDADTLALSAHKLGGPQGSGAVVAAGGVRLSRTQHGGGQERGLRAGTQNVSGIAGFGAAAAAAEAGLETLQTQGASRDALAARLKAAGAVVLGESAPRLPQTLCIAMPNFPAEIQVVALDLAGVMVSAGAACSSGKVKPSGVVEAMGRPDLAPFALRISGGWETTPDDWVRCGDAWLAALATRSARQPAFA